MPYMAEQKTKAYHISVDDMVLVSEAGPEFAKVTSVTTKTKYVYVKYEDADMEGRYGVDEDVIISRPKATRAEAEDAANRYAARWAETAIEEADRLLDEAKQKLLSDLAYRPDYHRHSYAEYVDAQVRRNIWMDIAKLAKVDNMGLVEAMRRIMENLTDELTNDRHESRSTSVLSNAVEDVERDVKAQWLRRAKFTVPSQLGR
jgi:uncharacterized protein YijF (DUF1287 family)